MIAKIITLIPAPTVPDSLGYGAEAGRVLEVLRPVRMAESDSYLFFEEQSDWSDRGGYNDFEGIVGSSETLTLLQCLHDVLPFSFCQSYRFSESRLKKRRDLEHVASAHDHSALDVILWHA